MSKSQPTSSKQHGPVSMTGFGRACVARPGLRVEVEIKTVNSRTFDFSARLPRSYSALEQDLRELVSGQIGRGRLEISVSRVAQASRESSVKYDAHLLKQYREAYKQALKDVPHSQRPSEADCLRDILQRSEVIHLEESVDTLKLERSVLLAAANRALDSLIAMRVKEGKTLVADIKQRYRTLLQLRKRLLQAAGDSAQRVRARLEERLAKVLSGTHVDQSRMLTEVALLVERSDTSEELVRIQSHLNQFALELEKAGVGRRLDFLIQELGREFNTIGSKVQDAPMQLLVVEAKAELEKIREQVQNLE